MDNIGVSLILFGICYILVVLIGIVHTLININILKMGKGTKKIKGEAYESTRPWHPFYSVVLYSLFGFIYLRGLENPTVAVALLTGFVWTITALVIDLLLWVVIKHPWSFTLKELLKDYQPWITLIYVAIFFAPLIGLLFI